MNVEIYRIETCNFGRVIFWMREDVYDFLESGNRKISENMQDYN
jgi:hypothetical protein